MPCGGMARKKWRATWPGPRRHLYLNKTLVSSRDIWKGTGMGLGNLDEQATVE